MSNLTTSASGEGSVSIGTNHPPHQQHFAPPSSASTQSHPVKKKRNLPGNPDPDAEVIALSPKSLLATNRFICEICNKGFQRDQNLQLHRRGHNLPWKLKQRSNKEVRKKVYVCPELSCVHHHPSRALGDLTGIKKHFCRKHGEKKWKCDKCSKRYAVQSDWKAHSNTCGTREYRCDCGTLFSRRDSFITHRAFCDALAEESARAGNPPINLPSQTHINNINLQSDAYIFPLKKEQYQQQQSFTSLRPEMQVPSWLGPPTTSTIDHHRQAHHLLNHESPNPNPIGPTTLLPAHQLPAPSPHMSATALLQKAAQMGATISKTGSPMLRTHNSSHVSAGESAGLDLSSSSGRHVTMSMTTTSHGFLAPFSFSSAAAAGLPPCDQFGGGASSLEEAFIGGILNPKKVDGNLHDSVLFKTTDSGRRRTGVAEDGGGVGNEGLTRDFLGLKPLSPNDILSFAGIGNCMSSSSSSHEQRIHQSRWQG